MILNLLTLDLWNQNAHSCIFPELKVFSPGRPRIHETWWDAIDQHNRHQDWRSQAEAFRLKFLAPARRTAHARSALCDAGDHTGDEEESDDDNELDADETEAVSRGEME